MDNLTDADGDEIKAYIATEWRAEGTTLRGCDPKPSINFVEPPEPCIEVTKDVNCADALPGKKVTYTICMENCGITDIDTITSADDTLLGDLKTEAQAAIDGVLNVGDVCCFEVDYTIPAQQEEPVQNQVQIDVDDVFDSATSDTSDIVWVLIADPNFTASKVCRDEPIEPGEAAIFDITIENTGDICLHFDVCDIDPCEFDLPPGNIKSWVTKIIAGDDNVDNTLTGTATLCDPCECIPYEEEVLALDECTVEPPEPCVEVTKDVNCGLSKAGDMITYTICIENCGDTDIIDITNIDDTLLDDSTLEALADAAINYPLEPGDVCCFDLDYTVPDVAGPLENTITVEILDEFEDTNSASAGPVVVGIVHPDFTVEKDCRTDALQPGETAIFDITVTNTGDVCLHIDANDLGDISDPCSFDLPAGDSHTWETFQEGAEDDVFNQVKVVATLRPGDPIGECGDPCECLPNVITKYADDTCPVGGEATRTPGFWKTHYYLAEYTLEEHCVDINLGWIEVNDVDVMMAIFWEKKAHKDKLCKARIHGAFHAMAAALNNCHPDGLSLAGYMDANCDFDIEDIPEIMGGCNINAIKRLTSCLAGYNEIGDDVEITFPDGLEAYNAQPKFAREQAEGLFPQAECDDCDKVVATKGNGPKGGGKGKGKNK
jgi:uncharacterized repeat protein (TIGR01451 family)